MPGGFSLIDPDTPPEAFRKASDVDGTDWDLVFSDEFNTPGRSFYPGDDPYWEAADLHYWSAPSVAVAPFVLTLNPGERIILSGMIQSRSQQPEAP